MSRRRCSDESVGACRLHPKTGGPWPRDLWCASCAAHGSPLPAGGAEPLEDRRAALRAEVAGYVGEYLERRAAELLRLIAESNLRGDETGTAELALELVYVCARRAGRPMED